MSTAVPINVSSTPVEEVIIADDGNLTIEVVEYNHSRVSGRARSDSDADEAASTDTDDRMTIKRTVRFMVDKKTVVGIPAYDARYPTFYARVLRPSGGFSESASNTLVLKGDDPTSIELLFRIRHKCILAESYDLPINIVWELIMVCDKYNVDHRSASAWFASWYQRQPKPGPCLRDMLQTYSTQLYPCWMFNHAKGFQIATQFLMYNAIGRIEEHNPTKHYKLHLPPRVIQQISAGKGRLRNIIFDGLFPEDKITRPLLKIVGHICREKTFHNYVEALTGLNIFPVETKFRSASINDMIERMESFNYENTNTCRVCPHGFNSIVHDAATRAEEYLDGLCLDCMSKSKSLTFRGDEDTDYWDHNYRGREHDRNCRIKHGEPTRYFSFMGRRIKTTIV